ncbi:MAG TPA: hypothetical protein VGB92_20535 [Longimicrobium sp.]
MRVRSWMALGAVLALGGCGKDFVAGGARDVEVHATGDATSEGSPSAARMSLAPADGPRSLSAAAAQGTVTFDARVSLVSSAQVEEVNRTPASTSVRIEGRDTVRLTTGEVRRASYDRVRIVFTRVEADVASGLVIGGVSVTGRVAVAIAPADSIVVERPVSLGDEDDDVRLLIDLDASAWLASTNVVTRIVPAAAFQSAVKVRTR